MIKIKDLIDIPSLNYHVEHGLTLHENVYRYSSEKFISLFKEAREALRDGKIQLNEEDLELLESTDIGEYGLYEGEKVALDLPTVDEAEYRGKDVALNKPKRGGPKKFVVYTKNDKGNVVKVNFGHGGSSARKKGEKTMKIRKSNKKARKSFRARHNCKSPGPKWKARYWSCRKW